MHRITHLLLVISIFGAVHASADSTKNTQSGATIAHTDNRAAGWIDVEVEDLCADQNVKCRPSASIIAVGKMGIEESMIAARAHGIRKEPPFFIGTGLHRGQTSPINKEAASCVLKNINKGRGEAAALAVVESCNILHSE